MKSKVDLLLVSVLENISFFNTSAKKEVAEQGTQQGPLRLTEKILATVNDIAVLGSLLKYL